MRSDDMTPDREAAEVAKGLNRRTAQVLFACDPERVEGAAADLLNLALDNLAVVRSDNTLLLTPLGNRVRAHLQGETA